MEPFIHPQDDEPQPTNLLLIVVGAHLRAEVTDRPLAYQLRQRINDWLKNQSDQLSIVLTPVVCCDLWYVNREPLQRLPTVSLGDPQDNALSAYFTQQLPKAFLRDEQMVIQLDPEFIGLRVCIWGATHERTGEAIEQFVKRYLDDYLRAVATQVEPHGM